MICVEKQLDWRGMEDVKIIMENHILNNSLWQWLTALCIFFLVWLASGIAIKKISAKMDVVSRRTDNKWDDLVAAMLKATKGFFLFVSSLYVALKFLNFTDRFHDHLNNAIIVVFLIQVGFWGGAIINFWLENIMRKRAAHDTTTATTMGLLGFGARAVFYTVVGLMILSNMGVNITALVAGLGIGGIAIGLALQNILGDLFSSLVIILDKPFVVGDGINVGNFNGTIENIGIKTTRVRSNTGEQLIFSNADILKNTIRNFNRMNQRWNEFNLNVSYDTPIAKLQEAVEDIKKIISAQPKVRLDRCHLRTLGDSCVLINGAYFVQSPDFLVFMDTQQKINFEILALFEANGINFFYPSTRLVWDGRQPAGAARDPISGSYSARPPSEQT